MKKYTVVGKTQYLGDMNKIKMDLRMSMVEIQKLN